MTKRIIFVVAHEGYHPVEYDMPKKMLEKNGFEVITASTKAGFAIAKDGSTTKVDMLVSQLDPVDYDGLVIIGGPGVPDNLYEDSVYAAVQAANMADKMLGAICHGTRVLAQAGALAGRKATGWNGDKALPSIYREHGVIFEDVPLLIDEADKRIVTARGPSESEGFGQAIMEII